MDRKDPREISSKRKSLYYIGTGMIIIGVVLFFSVFFSMFMGMSNDSFFMDTGFGFMRRGFFGFIMIGAGGFIRNLGARGAFGSGLILDPDRAREDLNPYSSAAGGMLNDALKEVGLLKKTDGGKSEIRIRCQSCRELNEEDARFCKSCGKEI
ncbi:MAG TPA: zinc ribbon domain-containing protein [Proteiniclasticum sp.]|nr:zinc ribbon domain-containing protein [Proteiniclasticum sp.]